MELFQRPIEWEQELKGEEERIKDIENNATKIKEKLNKKKFNL